MNFVLPQFIDMEAKIVGPLTLKQFGFVGVGTTISFLILFAHGGKRNAFGNRPDRDC